MTNNGAFDHTEASHVSSLTTLLDNLAGSSHPEDQHSLSRWSCGSLTQLKNHGEQFARNATFQNKHLLNFHKGVHQAWLNAVYLLGLLNLLNKTPYPTYSPSQFTLLSINRSLHTLQKHFLRVTQTLPKILTPYLDNENLIFTLLRNKEGLDMAYGYNFFDKHVKRSPCKGNPMKWLLGRYEARGFEATLPSIRLLFKEESSR